MRRRFWLRIGLIGRSLRSWSGFKLSRDLMYERLRKLPRPDLTDCLPRARSVPPDPSARCNGSGTDSPSLDGLLAAGDDAQAATS